jgi:hypothetical protein
LPKKIDNSFLEAALSQPPKERAQTIRQPAASKPEDDEFKKNLAAMLARGPGGRQNTITQKPQV